MKGAQLGRFWGRQFSFIVAALVFTTMFFWCWDSNPILMGLLSAPEQFTTHTSDLFVDDAADSSTLLNSKELLTEEDSYSQVVETTEYDKSTERSERKYENKVTSSFEKQDKKFAEMRNAKNYAIQSIVRWLDSNIHLRPQLKGFFRTISPQHFLDGDWNTGGHCDYLTPLTKESKIVQEKSSDPVIEDAVEGTKVKILDITAISLLRDEGHVSRYSIKASVGVNNCLHWCLPGIPDTWNELLYAQL